MLPRSSRPVPLQVHAGDSISVSITEQATDQWLIHFTDNTTGQTYDTTQQYTSSRSSAEWVEEAPSGGRGGVLPLDNFGTIQFTDGSAMKVFTTSSRNARCCAGMSATPMACTASRRQPPPPRPNSARSSGARTLANSFSASAGWR